jgi:hypothetical protein
MSKKKKKKEPAEQRNMVVKGMILHTHAKSWDARDRRSKDTRKERQAFNDAGGDEV